jgi:hypothetical protein
MVEPRRRSLLKSIATLPFAPFVGKLGSFAQLGTGASGSQAEQEYQQKYLAVRILRHINTVQAFFRKELQQYADVEDFKSSDTVRKFLDSGVAERAGIGRSLYEQLQWDEKEIVPGWQLTLLRSTDRNRYLVSLRPAGAAEEFPTFATDERGLIHEGQPLAIDAVAQATTIEELVDSPKPIRTHPSSAPSRLGAILSSLALIPSSLAILCLCKHCGYYNCCCDSCCGGCQTGCDPAFNCCLNCGCSACVWCVY